MNIQTEIEQKILEWTKKHIASGKSPKVVCRKFQKMAKDIDPLLRANVNNVEQCEAIILNGLENIKF